MREKGLINIVSGFLILCFSLLMFWECTKTKHVLWPTSVLLVILIFSIILIMQGLLNLRRYKRKIKKDEVLQNYEEEKIKWSKFILMVGIHFFYYISLHWLGFIVTTPIYIFIVMLVLGERNKKKITIISLFASLFFIFLFIYLLEISPPRGISFMRNLNSFFY